MNANKLYDYQNTNSSTTIPQCGHCGRPFIGAYIWGGVQPFHVECCDSPHKPNYQESLDYRSQQLSDANCKLYDKIIECKELKAELEKANSEIRRLKNKYYERRN